MVFHETLGVEVSSYLSNKMGNTCREAASTKASIVLLASFLE